MKLVDSSQLSTPMGQQVWQHKMSMTSAAMRHHKRSPSSVLRLVFCFAGFLLAPNLGWSTWELAVSCRALSSFRRVDDARHDASRASHQGSCSLSPARGFELLTEKRVGALSRMMKVCLKEAQHIAELGVPEGLLKEWQWSNRI